MKNELIIFFSWQMSSNTDRLNNKGFILSCIEKAASEIKGKGGLKDVSFKVLQGTGGEAGTPNMIETCLKRNDNCHIFIADISVDKKFSKIQRWVNKQPDLRERPNENVMYELGRADGRLDYRQVIHVANTVFGDVSENDYLRPTDLRPKIRPITFCLSENEAPEAEEVREKFVKSLKNAITESAKAALENLYKEWLPYESCERVVKELKFKKKFVFNESLRNIESAILDSKGILRVTGLNGVGKTRLVIETVLKEQPETPKIYCDCQLTTEERVIDTTTKLFIKQVAAVLILDNCDAILFDKIIRIYKRKNAKNKLIAIVDDPNEKVFGTDYNMARFGDVYEDVVDGIINELYGKQDEVSAKIKEFASGNPLMAVQAIEGVKKTGDIRDFNDQKLFSSLLSALDGSDERVIARSLALFTSIGYEGDAHKEIETIILNKNITGLTGDDTVLVNKADALVKQYLDRGLMQRVGIYVRFRTSAIAKMLAKEWFDKCSENQLENVIANLAKPGPTGSSLQPSFFEMIGKMEGESNVTRLLADLMKPGRLLASADFLNTEDGSKAYRTMVELIPDQVADSLMQLLGGLNIDQLKQIRAGRREIVWTLEKLCYRPETFDKAARLLLRLGLAENEHISNNATGQFISLFPVRLPATSVSLAERLAFLKHEFGSDEGKPLLMKALERALCTMNFIRFDGDVELAGKRYTFYEPKDNQEVVDYLKGCLDLVQQEIDGNTAYREEGLKILATNLRALNQFGAFDMVMPRVEKLAQEMNYEWDDLLKVLHFARKDAEVLIDEQRKNQVERLIGKMEKDDFVSRFARVESYECNDYLHMDEAQRQQTVKEKYEALAVEMSENKLYSKELLKGIYEAQTFFPYPFATKLAQLDTPEEQLRFASDSIDLMEKWASSIFVFFVKEVSEEVFAKIVEMIYEKGKQWLMFPLVAIRGYAFDHEYVNKLFELVEQNVVDASMFVTYWQHVRIDRLDTPEAAELVARVAKLQGGFEAALHMAMSQYLSDSRKHPELDDLFEKEMIQRAGDVTELMKNPHYAHILRVLLTVQRRENLARALAKGIFETVVKDEQHSLRYEVENVLKVLFEQYFDISWAEMSDMMCGEDGDENFVKFYFAFGFSSLYNVFPSLIFQKDHLPLIIGWCRKHTDVGPYRVMALAPLQEGEKLSEPVMMLLDNYGSDRMVRTALSDKLGSFAGPTSMYEVRAAMIEPLKAHKNPDVSNWATLEIERLKRSEEQSQKWEESIMMQGRRPSNQWTLDEEELYKDVDLNDNLDDNDDK